MATSVAEAFVAQTTTAEDLSPNGMAGCILWTGSMNWRGYGRFGKRSAHVFAWELRHGPVPVGLELDHLCRRRHCVNPDHLEPVTHHENLLRGDTIVGINARKTHCDKGHEFTPENTYDRGNGRECRICREAYRQAWKARRAERAGPPRTKREMVDRIPRRVAHATHALMAASKDRNSPVTTAEVCVYDAEAVSVNATGAALREAQRRSLAIYTGGNNGRLWVPTNFALEARQDFEDRYCDDTAEYVTEPEVSE